MRGRHTSLDKHLKPSVSWLESIPEITKIVLGFSENCRHKYAPGYIKFKQNVAGGIKVNGYSGNGVIDMYIKIDPISAREQVKDLIATRFRTGFKP
jgi:hypothetical protein